MEKYERLLPKGDAYTKADKVWTAWYKKAKICDFEQMLFLVPQTKDHATSSNYSPMIGSNGKKTLMNTFQLAEHPKILRVERNNAKVTPRER
jgi:hypothetical protein